jgi:hypothetical protein
VSKIRYLRIVFDQNLMAYEIPYFRAAVIEASDRKSTLFHNHDGNNGFIYRYPVLQYKIINKKPSIVCLREATDDIHFLLKNKEFHFDIKGRMMKFEIEDMHMTFVNMQTWDKMFYYNLHNYIPLNQDSYKEYQGYDSELERIKYLEQKLHGHTLSMMKELQVDEPVELKTSIQKINSTKYIEYKGQFHLTFSMNIKSNLLIPNYIGLGKGVTTGFGIIKQLSDNEQ